MVVSAAFSRVPVMGDCVGRAWAVLASPQFADLMVKDVETGECYRADKLLEAHIEKLMEDVTLPSARRDELRKIAAQADAYSPEQLGQILSDMGIRGAYICVWRVWWHA